MDNMIEIATGKIIRRGLRGFCGMCSVVAGSGLGGAVWGYSRVNM